MRVEERRMGRTEYMIEEMGVWSKGNEADEGKEGERKRKGKRRGGKRK